MAIREDTVIELSISIDQFIDKAAIRNYLLQQWIAENPGTKYRYFVCECCNVDFSIEMIWP